MASIDIIELIDAARAAGRREAAEEIAKLRSELRDWETFAGGCQRREAEARAVQTRSPALVVVGEPYLLESP
jgi:hypothetical protein